MLTEQKGIQVDKFYPPTDWQYSFPEGYTRLEYIQSTGTQYIDTRYVPTNNTKWVLDTQFTNISINSWNGRYNTLSSPQRFDIALNSNTYTINGGNTTNFYGILTADTNRHTFILDMINEKGIIDNSYEIDLSTVTMTSTKTVKIFARQGSSTIESYCQEKIYSSKFYENNIIQQYLVPAKRNSDNKPGMYDLVNNVFYTNSGQGEFVIGPELYSNNSQIDIRQKNNTNFVEKYKFNANNELVWANPQLNLSGPVGYTKVGNPTITDGIISEFSSSNYLSLQQALKPINNFECKLKFNVSNNSITNGLFHSSKTLSVGSGRFGIGFVTASNGRLNFFVSSNGTSWLFDQMSANNLIQNNTDYYVKFGWTGTKYYTDLSTDDINYNRVISYNSSLPPTNSINYSTIGVYFALTNIYPNSGSIDLKETYIKVNDKLWFYGKNYTSENYAPVPAGLNYNNTTTPSIGYVNTQTQEFIPAPTDGIKYSQTRDIKVIPPEDNTITLLYGVASDFSKYSLFGLVANTSSGNYDVYIDGVLYATTTKNTQTDIDFSALGDEYVPIGTCTTPEELVLHKIVIKPTTSGQFISAFKSMSYTGQGADTYNGIMWTHFELSNNINLLNLFTQPYNLCFALTAKNDCINIIDCGWCFRRAQYIKYLPLIKSKADSVQGNYFLGSLNTSFNALKRVRLEDFNSRYSDAMFSRCEALEQISGRNISLYNNSGIGFLHSLNRKLKIILKGLNETPATSLGSTLYAMSNLYSTKLDISDNNSNTRLLMYGTSSYPMRGLRGLKVSNEAPFTGNSPQINVSYTGLDRDALVELFNSLPTVTGGQTINITAATGNNLTKVGTPTIDENGIASGFSTSDYLKLSENFSPTGTFEIVCSFNTGNLSEQGIITGLGTSNSIAPFYINSSGTSLNAYLSSNGTSWNLVSGLYIMPLSANTTYTLKLEFTGTQYNWYSYENNEWVLKCIFNSAVNIKGGLPLVFGNNRGTGRAFTGSIDLENTYIKVDNNYIVKGYLTDNDRLIATNKGWGITG